MSLDLEQRQLGKVELNDAIRSNQKTSGMVLQSIADGLWVDQEWSWEPFGWSPGASLMLSQTIRDGIQDHRKRFLEASRTV